MYFKEIEMDSDDLNNGKRQGFQISCANNGTDYFESLTCPKCNDIFEAESKYTDHVLTHSPWYVMYICGVCGLNVDKKSSLANHIISHFDHRDKSNDEEGVTYVNPYDERTEDNEQQDVGRSHDDDSDSDLALIELVKKLSPQRTCMLQCKYCRARFSDKASLKYHIKTQCSNRQDSKRNVKSIKQYDCISCDKSFKKRRELLWHVRNDHSEDDYLKCDLCGKAYFIKQQLTKHLLKHLKGSNLSLKCGSCDKVFNRRNTLRYHERKFHELNWPQTKFSCEICRLPCISLSRLENHMRVHTGERPYQCTLCEKCFSHSGSLAQHMKTHEQRKHICSICNYAFTRRTHLVNHLSTHSGEKPFVCSTCGKTFAYSVTLKMHMRTHTGEKPFQCPQCGKAFVRRDQLSQHNKVHTREKPFVCEKCGKGFAHRSGLKVHTWRDHLGEFPPEQLGPPPVKSSIDRENAIKAHICSTCGKAFVTRAELTQHTVVHSGVKPYKCSNCEKAFARKSGLVLHSRVHSGEKPYLCVTCGKPFSTRSGLRTHILLVHSGEKPHKCSTCGKGFPTKDRLVVHIRLHTGEKPFICVTCGKGFTRSDNMRAHIKTHSGDRPFACIACDRAFYNKCELVKHLQANPMHKPFKEETLYPEDMHKPYKDESIYSENISLT